MDAGLGFSLFWFQPEFRTQSTWIAYQKVLVGLECAIEGAELEKTQDEYRRERERERERATNICSTPRRARRLTCQYCREERR